MPCTVALMPAPLTSCLDASFSMSVCLGWGLWSLSSLEHDPWGPYLPVCSTLPSSRRNLPGSSATPVLFFLSRSCAGLSRLLSLRA